MHTRSPPRWLRIVSIATAVLPVERSPMMSSRWPRPIAVIESIALSPVYIGSFTGCRLMTPGALNSSGRRSVASIAPSPSSGLPSGSTTRPSRPGPTGTLITSPVRRTGSPSFTCCHSPKSATPTLSSSRLNAIPVTPCSSSSRSSATQFSRPWTRAIPSPTWRTLPTSERSVSTSNSRIRSLRIAVISSGRSFIAISFVRERGFRSRGTRARKSLKASASRPLGLCHSSGGGRQFLSQALEPSANASVGAVRPDLEDDAADEARVDAARGFHRAAGGLLDRSHDRLRVLVRELVRGRELDREAVLRSRDERIKLLADLLELTGPSLLGREPDEVAHELVGVGRQLLEHGRLAVRLDLGVPEERTELGHLVHRRCESAEVGRY